MYFKKEKENKDMEVSGARVSVGVGSPRPPGKGPAKPPAPPLQGCEILRCLELLPAWHLLRSSRDLTHMRCPEGGFLVPALVMSSIFYLPPIRQQIISLLMACVPGSRLCLHGTWHRTTRSVLPVHTVAA